MMYDKGATMQEIVNEISSRGFRASRGLSKFNMNTVDYMLKNRRHIGEYRYRDIVKPNSIPAIVPEDMFERVQARLATNKKAPARRKAEDFYLLTTKLYCGYDGVFMTGESGRSRNLSVHRYYKCVNNKKKRICKKKAVRKEFIESKIIDEVMEVLGDDNMI